MYGNVRVRPGTRGVQGRLAFVPSCWVAAVSPGLPLHAQYTATTSPAACQEAGTGRRAGVQQAGFPCRTACCCCCCCCACREADRLGRRVSAIPPHPQITAVQQKIPLALPRGWHSEPSPSGRIAGVVCAGGIRMTSGLFWGRTPSGCWPCVPCSRSLGAESASWAGLVCVIVCPWFWVFGVGKSRQAQNRPGRTRACNTKRHPQG